MSQSAVGAGVCPHCGSKMVLYPHSLNQGLLVGLERLASFGGQANLKQLNLTRNQWDNFQKLRYWNFVIRLHDPVKKVRLRGEWAVTKTGYDFLAGTIQIARRVWSYRGNYHSCDNNDVVSIRDFPQLSPYYPTAQDYAKAAKAV